LFGLTLFAYVRFILWNAKLAPKWSVYLLSICVLSPLAIEIHHWGIGSAWHFPILFGILGICQMFRPDITTTRDIMGSFMLVLCMYSVGHGLILSFVIMMTWIMYRIGLTRNNVDFQSIKVFVARMSPAVGIYLVALILWFYGYKKVPGHELPTGPWTPQFWNFLGILLQNGIAMPRRVSLYAPWIGFLILIPYFVIPSCYFMGRHIFTRRIISPGTAAIIAFNFGLLGVAAVISYGRGNFPVGFTTSGRYLIFLLYLIPVSALLWAELLASRKRLHRAWLIISCILFLVLQLRLIRSFGQYDNNMLVRQEHLRLIKEYYQGMGPRPLYLPGFWVPVDEYLDIAKQRNRSFYRKMNTVGSLK
jgi:hypothetical protein